MDLRENEYVREEYSPHHFRTETPNIIWTLDLDPYEFYVYAYYKKVAGDYNGCHQKSSTILKKLRIGQTKLKEVKKSLASPRKELNGLSLIKIQQRFKPGTRERLPDLITVTNIWDLNGQTRGGTFGDPQVGLLASDCGTPRVEKEDPYKKIPFEESKRKAAAARKEGDARGRKPPIKSLAAEYTSHRQESPLLLFDNRRKIFEGMAEEEIEAVRNKFYSSKKKIDNPEAWIAQCVKEGWHKEKMAIQKQSDADIKKRDAEIKAWQVAQKAKCKAIAEFLEKKLQESEDERVKIIRGVALNDNFEINFVTGQRKPIVIPYGASVVFFLAYLHDELLKLKIKLPDIECEKGDDGFYVASFNRS